MTADPLERPIPKREYTTATAYALALVWINYYICRELFSTPAGSMASMHGYWIALAERAEGSWFHSTWWPYWNCGMPFEFAYAPLVPALTAAWAAVRHVPTAFAFNAITGVVYIAAPVTLFLMAWILTRSPGYSFIAALFYSLTAPVQVILPDNSYSLGNLWHPWRLNIAANWDETPHLAATALLPLAIALLWLSLVRPRWFYQTGAAMLIALATYASAFSPIVVALACICLVATLDPARRAAYVGRIAVIGVFAYALAAAFLPPSLIHAMATSAQSFNGLSAGSFTALAVVILGCAVLWPYVRRIRAPHLRFFVLFAFLTSAIPMLAVWLHRFFLPQARRYELETEMALSLLIVFGVRPLIEKFPLRVRSAIVLVVLCLAAEQVVSHRRFAKTMLSSGDITTTIEYRASVWADRNMPGMRVMLPGSIAQWADHFVPIQQFAGGSWSQAANPTQQLGMRTIFDGADAPEQDARVSLAWLKAYGAGAIAVSDHNSMEFWQPYIHPHKFEGMLPALWSEGGVTFYRIPQRTASLAHVIPEGALVRRAPESREKTDKIDRYDAALEDPSLPFATFEWIGRNRIRITTHSGAGQVVSVQVSYHPGWHATSGGRPIPVHRDGLGLMWLESTGPSEIILDYDGGLELRLCRWLTYLALAALFAFSLFRVLRRRVTESQPSRGS